MGKLINIVKDTFSVIPNEVFNDKRLDFRSRGILCTLLSLPSGWDFSVQGLAALVTSEDENYKGEKRDAIQVCLWRLEKLGYLERVQTFKGGRFAGYDYKINIPPIFTEKPLTEFPSTIFPSTEKPSTKKPKQ